MKLVRKWSYLYNKYDSCFFESYMNGNPRTEPSLAEVLQKKPVKPTRFSSGI